MLRTTSVRLKRCLVGYGVVAVLLSVVSLALDARASALTGLRRTVRAIDDPYGAVRLNDVAQGLTLDFLDATPGLPARYFQVIWRGFWFLPTGRTVHLSAVADDRVAIWIDGDRLLHWRLGENPGAAARRTVVLSAGLHALAVEYEQYGGAHGVHVDWEGLNPRRLFHSPVSTADAWLVVAGTWAGTAAVVLWTVPFMIVLPVAVAGTVSTIGRLSRLYERRVLTALQGFRFAFVDWLDNVAAVVDRSPPSGPRTTACLSLFGGLVFLFFFYSAYAGIPESHYHARDDGVITMSHARNWVDYGFIGISPSGERVEGYSSPAQFLLYAAAYALGGVGYGAFASAQTAVSTFLLGALFVNFFGRNAVLAAALTVVSALLLSQHTSFLLWHGSGMENAVTHVFMLAAILVLFRSVADGVIVYPFAAVVFAATITRVENIYHIGPLLLAFGCFWLAIHRSWRGFRFSGCVVGLWVLFNLCRYVYFGDVFPNTARGQGISLGGQLDTLLNWEEEEIEDSLEASHAIFSSHGGYLLLAAIPLLGLGARSRVATFLAVLVGSVVATSCISPFVFGEARLDETRTTTQMAVVAVLGVAAAVYYIGDRRHLFWIGPAAVTAWYAFLPTYVEEPRRLCCPGVGFERIRQEFAAIAEGESLPRPTVANPDLGVVSWHKQFNIVDFGMLGSPIMAMSRVSTSNADWLSDYFLDYASPDIIESHSSWSCRWDRILSDPRFDDIYDPVRVRVTDWTRRGCSENPESLSGVWVRRSVLKSADSAERRLVDDLLKFGPSMERLRDELRGCQAQVETEHGCVYVARTAYRFLPELRSLGVEDDLVELFTESRTREFDLYLVNGYRDARARSSAVEYLSNRTRSDGD